MDVKELKQTLPTLSRSELESLRDDLECMLSTESAGSFEHVIDDRRFSAGAQCPHCQGIHVSRDGKVRGKQRYICMDCHKTFGSTTNSIVAYTKKDLSVWQEYIRCMVNRLPLRACAERCDITLDTAFNWRHKILQALAAVDHEPLSGIVEADETYFPDNFKGNRNAIRNMKKNPGNQSDDHDVSNNTPAYKQHRESGHKHSRGKSTSKRGLSRQKICVPCAIDRNGRVRGLAAGRGKVKTEYLHTAYDGHIAGSSTLVTDKDASDRNFAAANRLALVQLEAKTASRKGLYNLQKANNLHGQLKQFVDNFKNVATKHLDNYIMWLSWNIEHRGMTAKAAAEEIMRCAFGSFYRIRSSEISQKSALPFESKVDTKIQYCIRT